MMPTAKTFGDLAIELDSGADVKIFEGSPRRVPTEAQPIIC